MFERTIALIGLDNLNKIQSKKVLIIGVGGVGGYAIETLIRSGITNITLIDYDTIDLSNINRQIIAKENNVGKLKVEAWQERIQEINSRVEVTSLPIKLDENNIDTIFNNDYDYIIDACDTVIVKKLLIKKCKEKNIKLITVCGCGKKLNPQLVEVCDIKDTSYDPLAKSIRKYVKDEKISGKVPVVFSREKPNNENKDVIASMAPVPAVAGIYAANYVISNIIKETTQQVYHGSHISGLKEIKKSKSTHNKEWVYATYSKVIALIFSSERHSDLYYSLSGNGRDSKVTLVERKEGMFKDIFNTSGSIYTLDAKNFLENQTGWNAEIVSNHNEKVLYEEKIDNVYNELLIQAKKGNINLYLYPNRPAMVPLDNSDLIPKFARYSKDSRAVTAFTKIYPELKDKLYKEIENKKRIQ